MVKISSKFPIPLILKLSYARLLSLVYMSMLNKLRTKCAYVWTGLRTCAAASTNSSQTIRREPKFVSFLCEHKENWMCRVSFVRLRFCGKLINRAPVRELFGSPVVRSCVPGFKDTRKNIYIVVPIFFQLIDDRFSRLIDHRLFSRKFSIQSIFLRNR